MSKEALVIHAGQARGTDASYVNVSAIAPASATHCHHEIAAYMFVWLNTIAPVAQVDRAAVS